MVTKKSGDFEKQLARLQVVVEQLEQGELPLDKGVALYKEGVSLAKACREQLEKARHEVTVFSDGVCKPFASGEAGTDQTGLPQEGGAQAGQEGTKEQEGTGGDEEG